jgi:hypothetical protein
MAECIRCGRSKIKFDMCSICRRKEAALARRRAVKFPVPPSHCFKRATAGEVMGEFHSLLGYMGILEPSGKCVHYRPGDAGFELIAMQYI